MRYNFSHEQLVELHSGVKNGTWVNHEVRMELIKIFEDYFVELATSPLYKITKLVNTYCEMHGWAAEDALTECLTTLCEQKGFTTDYAIERLNNMNDEYMEDR